MDDTKNKLRKMVRDLRSRARRLEKRYAYGPDKIFETEVTQRAHDIYLKQADAIQEVINGMD